MLPGLTPEEARDLLISVGTHHRKRRLSPVEVAEAFQKAQSAGASIDECASFVRLKGPDMCLRFQSLLNLSHKVRHLVDWGQSGATLSFESARHVAVLNDDEQEDLVNAVMSNAMTKDEVRQVIQLRKRSGRNADECVREVLGMRPTIVKKHVFLGAVTDEIVRSHLQEMKQCERDQVFVNVLDSIFGSSISVSSSRGPPPGHP